MTRWWQIGAGVGTLALAAWLTLLLVPLPPLEAPSSLRVLDRDGRTLRVYLADDHQIRLPVDLEAVSPHLRDAVLVYEDRYFRWHPGINPVATVRAAWLNLRAGRVISGGSTITQQLARMLDPRPRTIPAKLIEAFRALQLELRLSKDDIFAAYLNRAPYGGNIVGVEAAAHVWFGKPASALGPGEAATLAAIPQSPANLRPDGNRAAVQARRDEVLRRMFVHGRIDSAAHARALHESIPQNRRPFPLYAPHFCDDLRARFPHRGRDLRTTLDLPTQETVRRLLESHVASLRAAGIHQAAAVVIDNESMGLRALVGSADWFDRVHDGQVNGATAPRSPGSTLKPFVYALALDRGHVAPGTLLPDIPTSYAGYVPHNYDGRYHGLVSVRDALRHSLNVPAVALAHDIGLGNVHTLLERGGLTTLTEGPSHYGLSLVLGGAGVRLDELAGLFTMLANGGRARPLRSLAAEPVLEGERLVAEGAVWLVTDMLTDVTRPDMPDAWRAVAGMPIVAWKTGTSYGHRDAWSVGYTPEITVGVWVGNFDASGVPALVGAEAAGPLLFDIVRALNDGAVGFARSASVIERDVCALSGMPPGSHCPTVVHDLALRDRSPRERCTLHREVIVDDATGHGLCPICREGRVHHPEVRVYWPPAVAAWRRATGLPVDGPPTHLPTCDRVTAAEDPTILSPEAGVDIVLRRGVAATRQQVRFRAAVDGSVRRVFWFVDGVLLHDGRPSDSIFWPPEEGRHEIVLLDDVGRRAVRTVVVR